MDFSEEFRMLNESDELNEYRIYYTASWFDGVHNLSDSGHEDFLEHSVEDAKESFEYWLKDNTDFKIPEVHIDKIVKLDDDYNESEVIEESVNEEEVTKLRNRLAELNKQTETPQDIERANVEKEKIMNRLDELGASYCDGEDCEIEESYISESSIDDVKRKSNNLKKYGVEAIKPYIKYVCEQNEESDLYDKESVVRDAIDLYKKYTEYPIDVTNKYMKNLENYANICMRKHKMGEFYESYDLRESDSFDDYDSWEDYKDAHRGKYVQPISKDEVYADIDYICKQVAYNLKRLGNDTITTEYVVEAFRDMNDDYDDFWSRGLRTKEEEKDFVRQLLKGIAKYGITDVYDDAFDGELNESLNEETSAEFHKSEDIDDNYTDDEFVDGKFNDNGTYTVTSVQDGVPEEDTYDLKESEYRGYEIQTSQDQTLIRDKNGRIIDRVPTDDEAKEYIDDMLNEEMTYADGYKSLGELPQDVEDYMDKWFGMDVSVYMDEDGKVHLQDSYDEYTFDTKDEFIDSIRYDIEQTEEEITESMNNKPKLILDEEYTERALDNFVKIFRHREGNFDGVVFAFKDVTNDMTPEEQHNVFSVYIKVIASIYKNLKNKYQGLRAGSASDLGLNFKTDSDFETGCIAFGSNAVSHAGVDKADPEKSKEMFYDVKNIFNKNKKRFTKEILANKDDLDKLKKNIKNYVYESVDGKERFVKSFRGTVQEAIDYAKSRGLEEFSIYTEEYRNGKCIKESLAYSHIDSLKSLPTMVESCINHKSKNMIREAFEDDGVNSYVTYALYRVDGDTSQLVDSYDADLDYVIGEANRMGIDDFQIWAEDYDSKYGEYRDEKLVYDSDTGIIEESLIKMDESVVPYGSVGNPRIVSKEEVKDMMSKGYKSAQFKQSHTIPQAKKFVDDNFPTDAIVCTYSKAGLNDIYPEDEFILYKDKNINESLSATKEQIQEFADMFNDEHGGKSYAVIGYYDYAVPTELFNQLRDEFSNGMKKVANRLGLKFIDGVEDSDEILIGDEMDKKIMSKLQAGFRKVQKDMIKKHASMDESLIKESMPYDYKDANEIVKHLIDSQLMKESDRNMAIDILMGDKWLDESLSNIDDDMEGILNPVMADANKQSNKREKQIEKELDSMEKPDELKEPKKTTSSDLKKMHLSEALFESSFSDMFADKTGHTIDKEYAKTLHDELHKFYESWINLDKIFDDCPIDINYIVSDYYPFELSFDELGLPSWIDACDMNIEELTEK